MSIVSSIKKQIEAKNPIYLNKNRNMRQRLTNTSFTLLTPNCLGGILYHDLGLRFQSPTINLMMTQTDFLKFVFNLQAYKKGAFHFLEHSVEECPLAILSSDGVDDITINFTHYKDDENSERKWHERFERINYDNIFILLQERDGITKKDIIKLSNLKVRGIVVFTCNQYDDIPYSVYMDKYHMDGEVGNILKQNHFTGKREYENYFDFVRWFNEADGYPYNVQEFIINNCQTR